MALAAPRAEAAWSMHAGMRSTRHSPRPDAAAPGNSLADAVDLQPQYAGTNLLIHYGTPLVTEGNTVLVPVKVGVADTFRVEARRGSNGQLLWQLDTDYQLPPHNWIPSVGPALARPGRVYFPGAGGTLLWTDALDTNAPHTATRVAFFGNAAYASSPGAFNVSLRINTPITSDSKGHVYFGFVAVGPNPLGIPSGIAAVDSAGTRSLCLGGHRDHRRARAIRS
jgi:hypothetical protein